MANLVPVKALRIIPESGLFKSQFVQSGCHAARPEKKKTWRSESQVLSRSVPLSAPDRRTNDTTTPCGNPSQLSHGYDKRSQDIHCGGSHMITATTSSAIAKFSPVCMHDSRFKIQLGSTRRDGNCSRRPAITAVSHHHKQMHNSPRRTLLSASIRSWWSASAFLNRNNPCRHVGLLGINRKRAAQTRSFSC